MNALLSTTKRRRLLQALVLALAGNPFEGARASVAVKDRDFYDVVQVVVSFRDLDVDRPEDAAKLYSRIRHAARDACAYVGTRDPYFATWSRRCANQAIDQAVEAVDRPLVTAAHLRAVLSKRGATPKLLSSRWQE
jgi:UrcA family protein